jgi:hypothetical protein
MAARLLAGFARGTAGGPVDSPNGILLNGSGPGLASVARGGDASVSIDTIMGPLVGDGTLVAHRHGDTSAPTTHVGSGIHGARVRMAAKIGS